MGYGDLPLLSKLRPAVAKHARYVITENLRVLEKGGAGRQAELIAQSHISQRDDFECSILEIDALVDSSGRHGIRAARLCGGGFGGTIIALLPSDQVIAWWKFIAKENPEANLISTYAVNEAESEHAA